MNKIYRTTSWMCLGVASLTTSVALADGGESKPLTLSLGLKGFYDDNIFARTAKPEKIDSFGFQITPGIAYKVSNGQTSVLLSYDLDAKWYERRSRDQLDSAGNVSQKADPWDYAHYFKGKLSHRVSDTLSFEVADNFAITTEPQEFLSGQVARSKADALINNAAIKSDIGLSDNFGVEVAYKNNWYDYKDEGYKRALNRIENIPSLDLRYRINPDLFGVVGYRYANIAYDKNQVLIDNTSIHSDARDNDSHFIYVGADYQASPVLSFFARVGAEYTDFYNVKKYALDNKESSTTPYADFSAKWQFQKASYLVGGVRHQQNATDAIYPNVTDTSTSIILNQESTLVYALLSHNLTPDFRVALNGQFQNSDFKGGTFNNESEQFYSAGVTLSYAFNRYLAAEASYFYDKLEAASAVELKSRGYSRNRVFLGIRASY